MQRYLSEGAKNATISKLETDDKFDDNKFQYTMEFDSRDYGQLMQDRLLVFGPAVVRPAAPEFAPNAERSEPILLLAKVYRKHVNIQLPTGFSVDEMPQPFKAEADFAKLTLTFKNEGNQLVMDEELRTNAVTLPADQYAKVKKFFDDFQGADSQKMVLVKN